MKVFILHQQIIEEKPYMIILKDVEKSVKT